jgi:hypothetical protein
MNSSGELTKGPGVLWLMFLAIMREKTGRPDQKASILA